MVQSGFWTKLKKRHHSQMEVRFLRLFCNWERVNRAARRNNLKRTGEEERYPFRFLHHICTKKLKIRGSLSILHRPLAYDLRFFTMCPDVPSRKEASTIVLIMLLFALSFKANYPLASFSPWSQVSLRKHSWYEDPGIHLVKMQIQLPLLPVISKADSPSRIKVLVW